MDLFIACALNDLERVRWLISQGADVNSRNNPHPYSLGMSPLHCAVQCEHINIIQELLNSNADINQRDDMGETPLHYAVDNENLEIVRYLLSKGADINAQTGDGMTPLHHSTNHNNIGRYLIQAGINVNSKDKQGNTPLHIMSRLGIVNMVIFLLSYSDFTIKNNAGQTPLDVAVTSQIRDIIQTYIERSVDIKEPDCN